MVTSQINGDVDCRDGLVAVIDDVRQMGETERPADRLESLLQPVRLALAHGEVVQARALMEEAVAEEPSATETEEWRQLREIDSWPDSWLVAAIRQDPPDESALDVLVDRYWSALFGRCRMLTLNQERAEDLAQEAWRRLLRARHSLRSDGNVGAYLMAIATNLWRDAQRSARRAGPMAEHRLASLDTELTSDEEEGGALSDIIPDLNALEAERRARLAMDIDQALEQLTPLLRDVLMSRFIIGESCAEIGQRHDRTEQTVSSWVREAARQMRAHLEDRDRESVRKDEHEQRNTR
jgi:RNA polymerase sigma factor (sigma-70 family)